MVHSYSAVWLWSNLTPPVRPLAGSSSAKPPSSSAGMSSRRSSSGFTTGKSRKTTACRSLNCSPSSPKMGSAPSNWSQRTSRCCFPTVLQTSSASSWRLWASNTRPGGPVSHWPRGRSWKPLCPAALWPSAPSSRRTSRRPMSYEVKQLPWGLGTGPTRLPWQEGVSRSKGHAVTPASALWVSESLQLSLQPQNGVKSLNLCVLLQVKANPNKRPILSLPSRKLSKEQAAVLGAVLTGRNVFFTGSAGTFMHTCICLCHTYVQRSGVDLNITFRHRKVLPAEENHGFASPKEHLCHSQHGGGCVSHRRDHVTQLCRSASVCFFKQSSKRL